MINRSVFRQGPVIHPSVFCQDPVIHPSVFRQDPVIHPSVFRQDPVIHRGSAPDDTKANVLKQSLDYLDRFLSEGQFAVGDQISLADLALLATVSRLDAFNYRTDTYRRLHAWKTRLQDTLPYYQQCNAEGMTMFKNMLEQKKQ